MAKTPVALVPQASDLAKLTEAQTSELMNLVAHVNTLEHRYAVIGMLCGTMSLICSLAAFVYLVKAEHPTSAGVVLGAAVLGILRQMITGR
jgi:hypothetical protein